MNQAKNIKVGDVVQFPCICFAPLRSGWNGWIFMAAIVERLYTSKKGIPCAAFVLGNVANVIRENVE